MAIVPEEIESKDFIPALRGYDRQEVDAFLRVVAQELREAREALGEAEAERDRLRVAADPITTLSHDVTSVLKAAQDEAGRLSEQAALEAAAVREEAERHAAEVRAKAERDIVAMLEEASARRAVMLETAVARWQLHLDREEAMLRRVEDLQAAIDLVREGLTPITGPGTLLAAALTEPQASDVTEQASDGTEQAASEVTEPAAALELSQAS